MSTWMKLLPICMAPFSRRKRKGFLFVLTIVVMVTLLILGLTSIEMAIQARGIASRRQNSAQATALAEAGFWYAKASYESSLQQGKQLVPLGGLPYPYGPITLTGEGGGTFSATVYDFGKSGDPWLNRLYVLATGTTAAGQQSQIKVVMHPANFGKFAYFEQEEMPGGWMINGMHYTGDVYSNDPNGLQILWDGSSNNPIFSEDVSSHAPQVIWYNNNVPTSMYNIFKLGPSALFLNAPTIAVPSSTVNQQYAAWDGSQNILLDPTGKNSPPPPNPPFPATASGVANEHNGYVPYASFVAPSVYLNSNGNTGTADAGIYVNSTDAVNNIVFSVNSSGNQVISITLSIPPHLDASGDQIPASLTTDIITVNEVTNQTTLQVIPNVDSIPLTGYTPPAATTLSGVPNGLIYSTSGTVDGVHGNIANNVVSTDGSTVLDHNAWTVATAISNTNDSINLDGNLIYATPPNPGMAPSDPSNLTTGTLGLYSVNIDMADDHLNGTLPENISGNNVTLTATQSSYVDPTQSVQHNDMNTINNVSTVFNTAQNKLVPDGLNELLCEDRVQQSLNMAASSSGGQWQADNWSYLGPNGQYGYMHSLGGIINFEAGCFGYCTGSGQMLSGYLEQYTYDTRMDGNPPPFFPTTLIYSIDSWQVNNLTL